MLCEDGFGLIGTLVIKLQGGKEPIYVDLQDIGTIVESYLEFNRNSSRPFEPFARITFYGHDGEELGCLDYVAKTIKSVSDAEWNEALAARTKLVRWTCLKLNEVLGMAKAIGGISDILTEDDKEFLKKEGLSL